MNSGQILEEGKRVNEALVRSLAVYLPELSNSWWDECVLRPLLERARKFDNYAAAAEIEELESIQDMDLQRSIDVFHNNSDRLCRHFKWHRRDFIHYIHGMRKFRNWATHVTQRPAWKFEREEVYFQFATAKLFLKIVCPEDPQYERLTTLTNRLLQDGATPPPRDHAHTIRSAISEGHRGLVGRGFSLDEDTSADLEASDKGLLRDYGSWLEGIIQRSIEARTDDEVLIRGMFEAAPSEPDKQLNFLLGMDTSTLSAAIKPLIKSWRKYKIQLLLREISIPVEETEEVVEDIPEEPELDRPPDPIEEEHASEEIEVTADVVSPEPVHEEIATASPDPVPESSDEDVGRDVVEPEESVETKQDTGSAEEVRTPVVAESAESFEGLDAGILLWGAPGSGKSTYASSLVFHREREDESGEPDWYVMPADLEAAGFVADVVLAYRAREAPPKTDLVRPLCFRITEMHRPKKLLGRYERPPKPKREAIFNFVDPRGETFTNEGIRGEQGRVVLNLLEKAEGLLLLIDPTNTQQGEYLRMFVMNLVQMFQHMRSVGGAAADRVRDGQLHIPVAICLTKMDQFPEQDARELLLETVGKTSFRTLTAALGNYEIFGLSALGQNVVDDGGVMRPPNGLSQPWEALTPLKWLIEQK